MIPEPTAGVFSKKGVLAPGERRHFPLRFSERKLLLALVDLVLLNLAFALSLHWRAQNDAGLQSDKAYIGGPLLWFSLLSLVYFVCALVIGCYDLVRAAGIRRSVGHAGAAIALSWAIYLCIPYITPILPTSRLHLLLFPLVAAIAIGLWRVAYATIFAHPNFQQRALVIGAGGAGRTVARAVAELQVSARKRGADQSDEDTARCVGYRVLGFVDDAIERQTVVEGVPVVGTRRDLTRLVGRLQINELVVAITHLETMDAELFEAIQECREWGISVTTMTELYERLTGRVPIEHAGRALAVAMPIVQKPTHRFYLLLQRMVDILGALVGCVLLLGVIPVVALANKLGSPGPLFYSQERVGKGGRPFQILKFRSMRTDAEKFGATWAQENDPRITPVGKILRGTRMDEIPQFWNILRGDMSLIGPRPERPHFVEQLMQEIPFYRVRHAVKPGLTGWAQVRYRYGASVEDSLIKLQYDLYYIKRQSLLLDLEIVFKTIPIILGFKGR